MHAFYAFDAAEDTNKERSAGGDLNRADVSDRINLIDGEIDCSCSQGDGTRHKPKKVRAKRDHKTGYGGERCLDARSRRPR